MIFFLDKFTVILAYFISMIFFFNFCSSFTFWFWLEINMVLFLSYMITEKTSFNNILLFSQCLYYFIIQSVCSILFLIIITMETFLYKNTMLLILLVMKLGVSPFYFWVFKLSNYLSSLSLFFLLNFQKVPIIIFLFSLNIKMVMSLVLLNMLMGAFILVKSSHLTELFVSSSICFFSWYFLIFIWSMTGLIIFFVKYLVFNNVFLSLKKFLHYYETSLMIFTKIVLVMMFMMGLPPFIFFFLKIYLMKTLSSLSGVYMVFMAWTFSFVCLVCYFNFFFFLTMKMNSLYNNLLNYSKSDYILFFLLTVTMILFI